MVFDVEEDLKGGRELGQRASKVADSSNGPQCLLPSTLALTLYCTALLLFALLSKSCTVHCKTITQLLMF